MASDRVAAGLNPAPTHEALCRLPRRFDRGAIGAAGENAVLQARACRQFMRQKISEDPQQHHREKRNHRAAAASLVVVIALIMRCHDRCFGRLSTSSSTFSRF